MFYALVIGIGVPLFALVFSLLVKFFGLFWGDFATSGPGGFKVLYGKMLIISAIYLTLAMIGIGGLLGLLVMALAYKAVFAAGWVQAAVLGLVGGVIGWVLFILILVGLNMMGLSVA